ncbi:MAG: hypothetical protein GY822_19385 [Deltaproteobacteria bacterium]|nr:hypothetical protein [Deltaproteobacteria bacterium]
MTSTPTPAMASGMTLHEALLGRRTVYSFSGEATDDVVIDHALNAARWAPNHRLTQPWRFVVVGNETRAKLSDIAQSLALKKAAGASAEEQARVCEKAKRKFVQVGGLVVALQALPALKNPAAPDADERFLLEEDYASVACAVHNFVLSLWADGVAALWGTGGITRNKDALDLLGIDVDKEKVVGFLRFGAAEKVPSQKRLPTDDVIRRLP